MHDRVNKDNLAVFAAPVESETLPDGRPDQPEVIHPEFFDHATGEFITESQVPVTLLPERFEARTTTHLGENGWDVIEACARTFAESCEVQEAFRQ